jgi:hypothetical protein
MPDLIIAVEECCTRRSDGSGPEGAATQILLTTLDAAVRYIVGIPRMLEAERVPNAGFTSFPEI